MSYLSCAHASYLRFVLGLLSVLIFIYIADYSCKMNKRIIEFGLRRISELFIPRSALSGRYIWLHNICRAINVFDSLANYVFDKIFLLIVTLSFNKWI